MGVQHILGADPFMSGASALFMDIFPEPAIAWALGEAATGDLFGNLGKMLFGDARRYEKTEPVYQNFKKHNVSQHQKSTYVPKHKPSFGKRVDTPEQISRMFDQDYTNKFKK